MEVKNSALGSTINKPEPPPNAAKRIMDQVAEKYGTKTEDNTRTNAGRDAVMVDLCMVNGEIHSFPYPYLTKVTFTPGDTIVLVFGTAEITIIGRRLKAMRHSLVTQRCTEIREGSASQGMLKEKDAEFVEKITIQEIEQ